MTHIDGNSWKINCRLVKKIPVESRHFRPSESCKMLSTSLRETMFRKYRTSINKRRKYGQALQSKVVINSAVSVIYRYSTSLTITWKTRSEVSTCKYIYLQVKYTFQISVRATHQHRVFYENDMYKNVCLQSSYIHKFTGLISRTLYVSWTLYLSAAC